MSKYEKGKIVTGCVTGIEKYGIFVGLDELNSGLIHISEISSGFVKNINDYVNIGETIKVKVVDSDDQSCQVKLSIKDIDYRIGISKKSEFPLIIKIDKKLLKHQKDFPYLKNIWMDGFRKKSPR